VALRSRELRADAPPAAVRSSDSVFIFFSLLSSCSDKYLVLGVRDTNKITIAFWNNDLDSGTGADPAATSTTLPSQAAGNQWKHLAFTYFQGSNARDRKIWMNAVLSQSAARQRATRG